jgi:predicted ATPase
MDFIDFFIFDDQKINLKLQEKHHDLGNIYTLITGKNGSGKSRFLARLTNHIIDNEIKNSTPPHSYLNELQEKKVISISTTPFDKFPTKSKNKNYTYVGLKNNYLSSSSSKLIDSISKNLIKKSLNENSSFNKQLPKILNSIGFENYLKIAVKLESSIDSLSNYIDAIKSQSLNREEILFNHKKGEIYYGRNLKLNNELRKLDRLTKNLDDEDLLIIYEALNIVESIKGYNLFSITLNKPAQESLFNYKDNIFEHSLKVLLDYDFLRVSDIKLFKKDYGEMSLRRASSGEQCSIIIMLGIAANIENNSIILIDEPEVSLHPKWQEDFMPTLMNTFSIYTGCQFIIATHSPQIVSGMQGENCFVTDITTQKLYPASFFSGKSADFQLAEIFDSPGHMNEYLSRLCFNLIFKLRNKKEITKNDHDDLDGLKKSKEKINANDPIIALIETVEEVFKNASY